MDTIKALLKFYRTFSNDKTIQAIAVLCFLINGGKASMQESYFLLDQVLDSV